MLRFTKAIGMKMSIKNKLVKITKDVTDFLTIDQGGVIRTVPTSKQRKYKNVEIAEDFKKIDDKRKKERLQNMKKRQVLLEKKMKDQQFLLSAESQAIKTEIANIQKSIQQSNKELIQLQKTIQNTEAEHMLVEGYMKIAVTNHIKYLQYIHNHNTAFTLHPQTIKAIQNVQYCVQHNLPVKRLNLYEIMPEYFQAEIGELEDSVRRLIMQKNIFIENDDDTKSIRFFYKVQKEEAEKYGPQYIEGEITRVFDNMYLYCHEKLDKHYQLIDDVIKGKTVYRGVQHLMTVLLSSLPIKFLPEEEQLRKDLLEIVQLKDEWFQYKALMQEQIEKLKCQYVQPPPYIKNHPILFEKYQQIMEKYQNPLPLSQASFLTSGDNSEGILRQKMEVEIRKIVNQKYDKQFVEAMNNDRSLIDKKQIQIDFYNLSTNIYENFLALQDKSKSEQQLFVALPQQKSLLTSQKKKNLITLNHLTRMIYLNSKNKTKYNLSFFAQWFGVDKEELRSSLKYVTYLRALPSSLKDGKELETQILKFQD